MQIGSGRAVRGHRRDPLTIKSWTSPISNDQVPLNLKQPVAANDPLRAGSYSKTLTFTLSTTTP